MSRTLAEIGEPVEDALANLSDDVGAVLRFEHLWQRLDEISDRERSHVVGVVDDLRERAPLVEQRAHFRLLVLHAGDLVGVRRPQRREHFVAALAARGQRRDRGAQSSTGSVHSGALLRREPGRAQAVVAHPHRGGDLVTVAAHGGSESGGVSHGCCPFHR